MPTREQIALDAERLRVDVAYEVDPEADALMAALDALLSQPTPTAEAEGDHRG